MLKMIQFTGTELQSIKISSMGYSNFKTLVISVIFMQNHLIWEHLHNYRCGIFLQLLDLNGFTRYISVFDTVCAKV